MEDPERRGLHVNDRGAPPNCHDGYEGFEVTHPHRVEPLTCEEPADRSARAHHSAQPIDRAQRPFVLATGIPRKSDPIDHLVQRERRVVLGG
jgi:hypothetical protein